MDQWNNHPWITRRSLLRGGCLGFGAIAADLLAGRLGLAGVSPGSVETLHHRPRAKAVIFLYMDGGPSQVDTFDPKPHLDKYDRQDPYKLMKVEPTQFNSIGTVLASPWKFKPCGQSGLPISALFPHIGVHADKMCIIRSMVVKFPEHTSANYFLHTGLGLQGRPSWGAWFGYGLGSYNDSLPSFIVLNGGLIPPGGLDNFNSGFLPAAYQASVLKGSAAEPVANLKFREKSAKDQRAKLDMVAQLDKMSATKKGSFPEWEAAMKNQETAFRMQTEVPGLVDISQESKELQRRYGLESTYEHTRIYGRQCLLARRLVEKGVRFIEVTCPNVGFDRWDQHSDLKNGHEKNALAVDQPIGALLEDLKARGLLETTLVVFAGEFGRTPFAQGSNGRDHNPMGFSIWMAGGGTKGGMAYGATDEWGYRAVENPVQIHDLHATMLYLLGVDHKRLTVRFGGRDMRLTDVHGEVIEKILA